MKEHVEIEYLSKEHLAGFEHYKYSCVDTSPLSIHVMHPFWNKVVEYCPKWVAPNLLTFSGFLFLVANFLMFSWYDYSFYASSDDMPEYPPVPKWVFAMAAVNIFIAYTLDGIDGKQARRTQNSSPLGELFDHGLDSWTTMLITSCMFSAFGRTEHSVSTLRTYFILWNVYVNFYLSHWEKYNTGVLFLPWGYDFSMLATIGLLLVTSVNGHSMWKFNLPGGYSAGLIFELLIYVNTFVTDVPVVLWNIYKSYRDKTGKMRTFSEAMRPLVPLAALFTIITVWVVYSPRKILDYDPRMIYFMTGTIFSHICCRLIVSQMTNTRCEVFPWILYPATIAAFLGCSIPRLDVILMYLLSAFALITHIHYGSCVVRQLCRHFKINAFRVKSHTN